MPNQGHLRSEVSYAEFIGKHGRYEIYRDAQGAYRWRFVSNNGNIVGMSSESYIRSADAVRSIQILMSTTIETEIRMV